MKKSNKTDLLRKSSNFRIIIILKTEGEHMIDVEAKKDAILYGKNIIKTFLILSLPIMFSSIIKTAHDLVDMYVVANIEGEKAIVDAQVAAISFTTPIISVVQGLAMGLMVAGTALMSQNIGAKRYEKARKISGQLMLLCVALGIVFNILLYILAPNILRMMNAEEELFLYSLRYVRVRSFELSGLFVFFAFQATRQSMGDTVSPVILNIASIIINIVLTVIFVIFLGYDLTGAAWGTVIGNMVIIPFCIRFLRKDDRHHMNLTWDSFKLDVKVLGRIFALGWPAAISQSFTALGFVIVNSMIAGYDQSMFASIGVGNRINSLLLFPAFGIGGVLATFVGQNVGANNPKRAKQGFYYSLWIILVITFCGALVLIPFRRFLTSIFLQEEETIELASKYLLFLLCNLPLMAIFQNFIGVFQGTGRTDFVLILSTLRLWLMRVPALYLFLYVFSVGDRSVWHAMIISNVGATILGFILYQFTNFKMRKKDRLLGTEKLAGA